MQARLDGFTFYKLRPYQNGIRFCDEAKNFGDIILKLPNPKQITRLAVRYINRIGLSFRLVNYRNILTVPQVAIRFATRDVTIFDADRYSKYCYRCAGR